MFHWDSYWSRNTFQITVKSVGEYSEHVHLKYLPIKITQWEEIESNKFLTKIWLVKK